MLIDFTPTDKEEQSDAKVKTVGGLLKITSEKVKKGSDGWRQKVNGEDVRGEDLGKEKSRSGTKGKDEDEDEADVGAEAEDQYEDEEDDDDDDDDDEEDDDDDDDEGEEEPISEDIPEDAIFIPLGLVRERRPSFYKAADPEWQSFVKFSRDKKRGLVVRSRPIFSSLYNYNPQLTIDR